MKRATGGRRGQRDHLERERGKIKEDGEGGKEEENVLKGGEKPEQTDHCKNHREQRSELPDLI